MASEPEFPTSSQTPARQAIAPVIAQHVEDAIHLHQTRVGLCSAPNAKLLHLHRFDARLAAHLDGLKIAGAATWPLCEAALESLSEGAMFTATVRAIEDRRQDRLDRLFLLARADHDALNGLLSAFGWLNPSQLRGLVAALLTSSDPFRNLVGIAASAMHRVDPGLQSAYRFEDTNPAVRARAFRTAGELGKRELVSKLAAAIGEEDRACQFWGAWSAVLLGDRQNALECLKAAALIEATWQPCAFQLAMQAMSTADTHAMLRQLAQDPVNVRMLIQGVGLSGDLTYVPWLIGHMADDKLSRLAGEAFSMITGADLALLDLERKPPEGIDAGPNDDPEDDNVDMDADEDMPWADQARTRAWWAQQGPKFSQGVRHFVGAPLSPGHCIDVLKTGYQRQRIAAAYHLCLLNPGTPLFEWRAPAWRQQRELAQMA